MKRGIFYAQLPLAEREFEFRLHLGIAASAVTEHYYCIFASEIGTR